MSLHLPLHHLATIHWEGEKEKWEKLGTEEIRYTSLCTTTLHTELYVCMFLLLVTLKL